jgi:hypothetical protein
VIDIEPVIGSELEKFRKMIVRRPSRVRQFETQSGMMANKKGAPH